MVGRATAIALLAELKSETIQLFNSATFKSQQAGIDNKSELNAISIMIHERRYETARVYLEALLERLPATAVRH